MSKKIRKLEIHELGRISVEDFKKRKKFPLVLVLDNIRSMYNVGSAFRTSDAFLLEKIYLCGITATPPNREINKSALGATDSVAWEYRENPVELVKELKKSGYSIIAIEQAEGSIVPEKISWSPDMKTALIFGNEVKGVDQEILDLCEQCIEIPQLGTKHSLNVSVSIGIILWELMRRIDINQGK
jgi:tRNA G18 (ribose-2'-O)-methylase SpoU